MRNDANILKIEEAENCYCVIEYYVAGHSKMAVKVILPRSKGQLFIVFSPLEYFSGPRRWKGANFRLGEERACLDILRTMEHFDEETDEELLDDLEGYRLYVVSNSRTEVRIVAGGAALVNKL